MTHELIIIALIFVTEGFALLMIYFLNILWPLSNQPLRLSYQVIHTGSRQGWRGAPRVKGEGMGA